MTRRNILDKLGDKLELEAFSRFNRHYPYDVSRTYALSGSAAETVKVFDKLVADKVPSKPEARKLALEILEKAAEKDQSNEAKFYFDHWKNSLRALDHFDKGEWVELAFDEHLSIWEAVRGKWEAQSAHAVIGNVIPGRHPEQGLKCTVPFKAPYEIECDVEFAAPESGIVGGIMLNDLWDVRSNQMVGMFGVNPLEKELLFSIPNEPMKREKLEIADPRKCHLKVKFWNPKFEFTADSQMLTIKLLPKKTPSESFVLASTSAGKMIFRKVRIHKLSDEAAAEAEQEKP